MASVLPRPNRSGSTPGTFSADAYFSMQSAPENLEAVVKGVEAFIARQMSDGRRVVLVTVSRRSFHVRMLTCAPNSAHRRRAAVQRSPWSSTCETELIVSTLYLNARGALIPAPSVRFLDNFSAGESTLITIP